MQTAINIAKNDQARAFNAQKLNGFLPEIRKMTTQPPEDFYPRLCQIFNECGVSFVLLPHLKNSKINGAVKWIGRDKVVLAMNDRCNYADIFWFSLFHEIKHVLQQKVKMTFVSASELPHSQVDASLEEEADCFAQEYLIPSAKYEEFVRRPYFSDSDIVEICCKILEFIPASWQGDYNTIGVLHPIDCC